MDIAALLKEFTPQHRLFIGVDSDGTAFDAMGIKHKKAFIPAAIHLWGLETIEKEFTEVAEFVNLYSGWRGVNRFPGLLLTFDFLAERLMAEGKEAKLPDYRELREFVDSGLPMSNLSLEKFKEGKNNHFLEELLVWSKEGDQLFSRHVHGLMPFGYVKESLKSACGIADIMVISAASSTGLKKDWGAAGILQFTSCVAGQEAGGKAEQLKYAVKSKYAEDRVLMIGDAPGDYEAAKANHALFYPIQPGKEEESWERFYAEALEKFISGSYKGEYMDGLVEEFLQLLPWEKPWMK